MARITELSNQESHETSSQSVVAATAESRRGIHRSKELTFTLACAIALILVIGVGGPDPLTPIPTAPVPVVQPPIPYLPWAHSQQERLSAAEFARLVRDFSEDGGYFFSDNLTSNETAYLHVVSRLKQLGATGGAYIGVGPEQNFTYIAKVRPRIAFIVDIRRQAMIQHLMFKAIFHLAPTRTHYLALLLSKSLNKQKVPPAGATINEILTFISHQPVDDRVYQANLEAIRRVIRQGFQVELSDSDQSSLAYVYRSFRSEGLDAAFRMDGSFAGPFPTLKELILEPDQFGKLGNFLASTDDYNFVRQLQERNMIIPLVGDFAGTKALAAVGEYLKKNGYTVSAFYTSNVEQYLFQDELFPRFVSNVRRLPIDDRSLFIRAVLNMRFNHPARIGGHTLTTLLQKMTVFLGDFDSGLYHDYFDVVTTHYIAGEPPRR